MIGCNDDGGFCSRLLCNSRELEFTRSLAHTHFTYTLCNELFTELRTSSFFSYHTAAAPCVYEITYMHELAEVTAKMNIRCTLQEKEKNMTFL